MNNESVEKRSESRTELDKYHSVEFDLADLGARYQFKIWNMSSRGMCLLVREDSDVVKCLQVGDTLDMKYYTSDASLPPENLTTQIKHVTKEDEGRFQGHYLVGLFILENQESRDS